MDHHLQKHPMDLKSSISEVCILTVMWNIMNHHLRIQWTLYRPLKPADYEHHLQKSSNGR